MRVGVSAIASKILALNNICCPDTNPEVFAHVIILVPIAVATTFVIARGGVIALSTPTILATVAGLMKASIEPDAVVNVIGTPPTVIDTVNSVGLKIPTT